ncbi:MAG: hypothetical protein WC450_12430, partial [Candidatus Omnitrophota bacterium]
MSDQIPAPEVPVTDTTKGPGETAPVQDTAEQYFYETQFDGDKEPTRFKSKDELDRFVKTGTMRHQDYFKKYDAFKKEREDFTKQQTEFNTRKQTDEQLMMKYHQMDNFLKQRPDVYQRILKEMNGTSAPQANELESKVMKEVEAIKEELDRRDKEAKNEQYRNQVFEKMGTKYQDFNKDEIMELMQEVEGFQSLPPEAAMESFAELLYHARKGRQTPAQIEQRLTTNLQK